MFLCIALVQGAITGRDARTCNAARRRAEKLAGPRRSLDKLVHQFHETDELSGILSGDDAL